MKKPTHKNVHPLIIALSCLAVMTLMGCLPRELDSLVTINAPTPFYRFEIAKHIRGSSLWRAYLERLSAESGSSESVVTIDVAFEREITDEEQTGDYDDGLIYASFELKEHLSGATLLTDSEQFPIPDYVIVREDATRDEIQDEAFSVIEEKAVRFIRYAMDQALIQEMGRASSPIDIYVRALEEVRDGHWSITLSREAGVALAAIHSPMATSDE